MSARGGYPVLMNTRHDGSVRIALIEPAASEAAWIASMVRTGSVPADVADVMTHEHPDMTDAEVILIGLESMGETEQFALKSLRAGFPNTPLVVLAGPEAAASKWEALRLGAQLVLSKTSLTSEKLSSALRFYTHYGSAATA